jgi:hypothetical protein
MATFTRGAAACAKKSGLRLAVASCTLAIVPLVGCGGSTSAEVAKAATTKVQAAVEQVQETAAQASGISDGSVELTIDGPLKIDKCFARFTPKGATRPAVVQLMTYEDPASEDFPSLLLWARGDAVSATELVGQTLEGYLYVQRSHSGGLWSSSNLEPIAVKVLEADLLSVTCEIADAKVTRADGEGSAVASGKMVALWREPAANTSAGK